MTVLPVIYLALTNTIIETITFDKLDTLEFTPNAYVPTAQLDFDDLPQTANVRKVLQQGLSEGFKSLFLLTLVQWSMCV